VSVLTLLVSVSRLAVVITR